MFVRDMILSSLRRWYLLLIGVLITAAATYAVSIAVHPTFQAKASIVLIPPKAVILEGDNPYLYLGGLDQALGVLQVKVSSPDVSDPLVKSVSGGQLEIVRDTTTAGPILAVTATANEPDAAMSLLSAAEQLVPSTLASLQADMKVPAASVITSIQLSADTSPTKVDKKQVQYAGSTAAVGLALTFLGIGLLDRSMSRRKERKLAKGLERVSAEAPVLLESRELAPPENLWKHSRRGRGANGLGDVNRPAETTEIEGNDPSNPEHEDVSA